MTGHRYAPWLAAIAALAGGIFAWVLLTRDRDGQEALWGEVGKAAVQVIAVLVLGAAVKLLAERHQETRGRAEQNARFRQDKYDRLVATTNRLRGVPILIDANRTVATVYEQMQHVIDAGVELRMIKHQIWSSREVRDPPFPDSGALVYLFESLYHYTDWASRNLALHRRALLGSQPGGGNWVRILQVDCVRDMLRDVSRAEREQARDRVEEELAALARAGDGRLAPEAPWSWLRYEETEAIALERITRATLRAPPPRRLWRSRSRT